MWLKTINKRHLTAYTPRDQNLRLSALHRYESSLAKVETNKILTTSMSIGI